MFAVGFNEIILDSFGDTIRSILGQMDEAVNHFFFREVGQNGSCDHITNCIMEAKYGA